MVIIVNWGINDTSITLLIDWVFNGTATQKVCANCVGGKPAKNGQQDTMQNTSRYSITMYQSETLPVHKRNNRLCNRTSCFFIITLAPSPIPSQIPL